MRAAALEPDASTASADAGAGTAWLSWLRLVAIAGVVTIHSVGGTVAMAGARDSVRGQLAILLDIGAIFAVPVFVMVSGALVLDPSRYRGPRTFIRRRIWRIVLPLAFWHLWYYLLIVWVMGRALTPKAALVAAVNGNLYSALYFFWIVLGLSLIAPVLIPFIADTGAKGALVAGLGFAAIPVVTIATMQLRGVTTVLTDLAWTWWLPYLGFFLLGWACRDVVLRGLALAGAVVVTAALGFLTAWQWRNPAAPSLLQQISPVSYYSLTVLVYSVGIFVTAHSLVRPGGLLSALTSPRATAVGRTLGDATLGVFALHLTVLYVVLQLPWIGGAAASPSGAEMVARVLVVFFATYVLVLAGRRIPGLRALL